MGTWAHLEVVGFKVEGFKVKVIKVKDPILNRLRARIMCPLMPRGHILFFVSPKKK